MSTPVTFFRVNTVDGTLPPGYTVGRDKGAPALVNLYHDGEYVTHRVLHEENINPEMHEESAVGLQTTAWNDYIARAVGNKDYWIFWDITDKKWHTANKFVAKRTGTHPTPAAACDALIAYCQENNLLPKKPDDDEQEKDLGKALDSFNLSRHRP